MAKCGERISHDHDSSQGQAVSRYLGLSLGGAKSDRTCLCVVDYYRKQEKSFVVDIFESIGAQGELTSDQMLLDLIDELSHELSGREDNSIRALGVDAPLTLPPCFPACDEGCEGYDKCKQPAVKWMRKEYQRAKAKNSKLKHFTPYSQRPVDLYFRYRHSEQNLLQDETMGANMAPQAVRMSYLKRRLDELQLVEVWPKLALFYLQKPLKITRRELLEYRNIERGAHVRERVIEKLVEKSSIFIYERDLKKFVANMDAFDSFICAWVAMQSGLNRVVRFSKSEVPLESGWVQIPEL